MEPFKREVFIGCYYCLNITVNLKPYYLYQKGKEFCLVIELCNKCFKGTKNKK